jgi:thioredoxin 1
MVDNSTKTVIELNDSLTQSFIAEHKVCLVDIFASWCGTCRLFYPAFEKAAQENKDFNFAKIDGEKNPNFSFLVGFESIPYVAVFVDGKLVGGKVCTKKETLDEMIATIRTNLGGV